MESYTYLVLMALTVLPFIVKYRDRNMPLHRNVRYALAVTGIVAVPFLVWDVIVTEAGHWSFSDTYTTGITIINLPLEEVLFFIAVPLAAVLVWETVGFYMKR